MIPDYFRNGSPSCRTEFETVISLGTLQPSRTDQGTCLDDRKTLERGSAVPYDTHASWVLGRDQQSCAGGEAKGSRIPLNKQLDRDDVSDHGKAESSACPHKIARNI